MILRYLCNLEIQRHLNLGNGTGFIPKDIFIMKYISTLLVIDI